MSNLFETGIRPIINQHLAELAEEERDYGEFWSASSAGYCMRKNIFERLKIPHTADEVDEARKQRVFSSGHIFHEWIQRITEKSGISVAQEIEMEDDDLMIRGHADDIVLIKGKPILYDYKTAHSRSFHYAKKLHQEVSHYHQMQVGTYLYILRSLSEGKDLPWEGIEEARVLKISKDDLTMDEYQVIYTPALEQVVLAYWQELNRWWKIKKFPPCTCHLYEGGFMAKEKYNPFFYEGEPCSMEWYHKVKKERKE